MNILSHTEELAVLTDENYYSDTTYLSTSRFKEYMECPARQQMVDLGFWEGRKKTTALLLGNYVHSYFESMEAHKAFLEAEGHSLISSKGKTKGQLKAEFKVANKMIETLEREDLFLTLYNGSEGDDVRKEFIVTGNLYGIPFKAKIDSLNLSSGTFVDLKTMESIQKEAYSTSLRRYVPQALYNIIEYRYDLQIFVYQQLLRQTFDYDLTPYIVAVSKETIPDKEIILVDDALLERGRQVFEANVDTIRNVLNGVTIPESCGHCDYCLSNKHLTGFITIDNLMY